MARLLTSNSGPSSELLLTTQAATVINVELAASPPLSQTFAVSPPPPNAASPRAQQGVSHMKIVSGELREKRQHNDELKDRWKFLLQGLTDQLKAVIVKIRDPGTSEKNREQLQTLLDSLKEKIAKLTPEKAQRGKPTLSASSPLKRSRPATFQARPTPRPTIPGQGTAAGGHVVMRTAPPPPVRVGLEDRADEDIHMQQPLTKVPKTHVVTSAPALAPVATCTAASAPGTTTNMSKNTNHSSASGNTSSGCSGYGYGASRADKINPGTTERNLSLSSESCDSPERSSISPPRVAATLAPRRKKDTMRHAVTLAPRSEDNKKVAKSIAKRSSGPGGRLLQNAVGQVGERRGAAGLKSSNGSAAVGRSASRRTIPQEDLQAGAARFHGRVLFSRNDLRS